MPSNLVVKLVFYGVKCGVRLEAEDAAVSVGAAHRLIGLECGRECVVKRMTARRDESFSRLGRLAGRSCECLVQRRMVWNHMEDGDYLHVVVFFIWS